MKEAEGYKLFLANHSNSSTGYLGVCKVGDGKFQAQRKVLTASKFTSGYMTRRWRRRSPSRSTRQGRRL